MSFAPTFWRQRRCISEDSEAQSHLVQLHYVMDELIPVEAASSCRAAFPDNV
jgi:hypothetical protein